MILKNLESVSNANVFNVKGIADFIIESYSQVEVSVPQK